MPDAAIDEQLRESTSFPIGREPVEKTLKAELSPQLRQALAVGACLAWMGVSSGLILVNKYIMSTDNFHYPMALSGLGMLFSSFASFVVCRVLKWVEPKRQLTWRFWLTRILPVGLFMALTLHFGNVVYLYLTVSFIQMLKAFTPIVTMFALFAAGLETPTPRLISAVVLIAVGTAIASYGEINLSVIGVVFMFMSESFESTRLVMTQILLVGLKFHPIEGLMHLAPACTMWLFLGVLILEWPTMAKEGALGLMQAKPLLYMSAAAMGFCVNALAYVVIQTTSSLTLKVLGTVKNAMVVWIGVVFLRDVITGLQGLGYAVSLGAFAWYNYLKLHPGKSAPGYSALPTKDSDANLAGEPGRPPKPPSQPAWKRLFF